MHAFADGEIFLCGYYPEKYDWGHVIITRHRLLAWTSRNQGGQQQEQEEIVLWALHGHLAARSLEGKAVGDPIKRGDVLGWMGTPKDNGQWFPHTHFQLLMLEPAIADCPGVVAASHRTMAKLLYPDPCCIVGGAV